MKRETDFTHNGSRYDFDNGECAVSNGFAQVDTRQDAWYFGIWTSPSESKIVFYMEGDIYRDTYDTPEAYIKAIRELCNENYVIAIDAMLSESIKAEFAKLDLSDLLH